MQVEACAWHMEAGEDVRPKDVLGALDLELTAYPMVVLVEDARHRIVISMLIPGVTAEHMVEAIDAKAMGVRSVL